MDGGREDVVRALAHVDVVVRVHVVAGERGDHLVRVHVRARAGAGLEDVDRELVVVLAVRDRVAGGGDPLRLVRIEQPELGVRPRRGGLDPAEPARDGHRNRLAGDGEVSDRLARLASPQLPLDLGAHGGEVYPPRRPPATPRTPSVAGSVARGAQSRSSVAARASRRWRARCASPVEREGALGGHALVDSRHVRAARCDVRAACRVTAPAARTRVSASTHVAAHVRVRRHAPSCASATPGSDELVALAWSGLDRDSTRSRAAMEQPVAPIGSVAFSVEQRRLLREGVAAQRPASAARSTLSGSAPRDLLRVSSLRELVERAERPRSRTRASRASTLTRAVSTTSSRTRQDVERVGTRPTLATSRTRPRSGPFRGARATSGSARAESRSCAERWRGPDLNRRHHGFQPCALPTELPRLEFAAGSHRFYERESTMNDETR